MRRGSLGQALLKALGIQHSIVVRNGKWEFSIPTCLELIEQRVKPLPEKVAKRVEEQKRLAVEIAKEKDLSRWNRLIFRAKVKQAILTKRAMYFLHQAWSIRLKREKLEKTLRKLERKFRATRNREEAKRIYPILAKYKTVHYLMKNSEEYYRKVAYRFIDLAKKYGEQVESFKEFRKKFLKAEWYILEIPGIRKGYGTRKWAEIGEYENLNGFRVHYLNYV